MPVSSLILPRAACLRALFCLCALTSLAHGVELDVLESLNRSTAPGVNASADEDLRVDRRDQQLGPATDRPHHWRAALEVAGVLSIGVTQYWINRTGNSGDWDFPHWSDRLTTAGIRFDNNTHVTNNVLHPLSGSAYYGLARANGLGVGGAALYTFAASAVWEWGLEWREKVSINDMVATTVGGIAAGEFFTQLGGYLNSAPAETNAGQDLAKVVLGFPVWAHDRIDGRRPPAGTRDNLGFNSRYHHRFTLGYENAWIDNPEGSSEEIRGVALGAQLVSLPGYLDPESFSTWFTRGNFARADFALQFNAQGLREAALKFDAVLLGYYTQQAHPAVLGALVGLATGIEFLDRDTLAPGDAYALLHCFGPELATTWKSKGYQLDLRARGYADFASIRSLAWPAARQADPGGTYKSSLERQYQYHLGLAARFSAELSLHAARIFAELGWGSYRSIQGMDRFQEEITRDLAGAEILAEHRVGVAIEPPGTPLRLHTEIESFSHQSSLGGLAARREERRLVAGAGIVF